MSTKQVKTFDVAIVGAGVTGTALAFMLSNYSNVKSIALIEKYADVAQVNSSPYNNAQTSHDGSTESNYNLPHALVVKRAATALRRFALAHSSIVGLYARTERMLLAVGDEEVRKLEARFEEFKTHYPDLRLVYAKDLHKIEPNLMKGRDPFVPVAAIVSTDGYAINYYLLSEAFLADARLANPGIETFFSAGVKDVKREDGVYILETEKYTFQAKVVVFASGAYSLLFAQQLGYGLKYGLLSVGGSFYTAPHLVDNKVYCMQDPDLPFAAIHADPSVLDHDVTRLGPTTKPLPVMERYHWETFLDYLQLPTFSVHGILTLLKILADRKLFSYAFVNALYDVPIIGKLLFLKQVRKIIPSIRYRDLQLQKDHLLRNRAGGLRPQVVDLQKGTLEMGDKTIVGDNAIFDTTPSPGASVCLANAERDARKVIEFLGNGYWLDTEALGEELGLYPLPEKLAA